MRIRSIKITNFRNFASLSVALDDHAVVVGPNGAGKSNLLFALRLVLDPSLPDSARQLRQEDFWDGLPRPLPADARIQIQIDLTDFEKNDDQLASLAEYLVETEPMVARLTYVFCATMNAEPPRTSTDFDFFVFGGDRQENRVGYDVRRRLPVDFFQALRDAEGDLATWRRSPLRPLLERAWAEVSESDKALLAGGVSEASALLTKSKPLLELERDIENALAKRTDGGEATDVRLGVSPADAAAIIRIVRLLLDGGRRGIGEVSLGVANLLFFTLKLLELGHLVGEHARDHTFMAIEEPEAHLHPHLQRQMFRSLLRLKPHLQENDGDEIDMLPTTILVTTHSPHLASIAPLKSLVLLRRTNVVVESPSQDGTSAKVAVPATVAASIASAEFTDDDRMDMERYLEVTRAEMLFARGVILVEGEAEKYLVPRIAALHGKPLDAMGVSICSIGGTHFSAYVSLLVHLAIPFAVITDGDPSAPVSGEDRVRHLLKTMLGSSEYAKLPAEQQLHEARKLGIFVGTSTLELDLLKCGRTSEVLHALNILAPTGAARKRAQAWLADVKTLDESKMLADITAVGKGRYAQRLAALLTTQEGPQGPAYVVEAIDYIASALGR